MKNLNVLNLLFISLIGVLTEGVPNKNLRKITLKARKEAERKMSKDETTQVVVLGYDNLKISKGLISFTADIVQIQNKLYSKEVRFPITIIYNSDMIAYKQTEAVCTLKESNSKSKIQYLCEAHEETTNIKQIKVEHNFNFSSQNNVEVIGITPIARRNMNNIQTFDEQQESNKDSNIYIMNNSTLVKKDDDTFVIYGVINGLKPKFITKNLNIKINLYSDETPETEVQCFFRKLLMSNYSLHCEEKGNFDGYLQSAVSYVNNKDILLINFDNEAESYINVANNDCVSVACPRCDSSVKPGILALVIGLPILALLTCCLCLGCFCCLRRGYRRPKSIEEVESTIKELKDGK